jgi:hypothetical protein
MAWIGQSAPFADVVAGYQALNFQSAAEAFYPVHLRGASRTHLPEPF